MLPVGQIARHKQCRAIVVVVFQLARHRPRPLTIVGTARIWPGIRCDRVSYSTEQTATASSSRRRRCKSRITRRAVVSTIWRTSASVSRGAGDVDPVQHQHVQVRIQIQRLG